MERSSIHHRANDNYAYTTNAETLHIRLRTKKQDISYAGLIFGDPYISDKGQWQHEEKAMSISGSDNHYDYWHIYVKPPYRRIRYGFKVHSGDEEVIYTEKGFFNEPPNDPGAISPSPIFIKMKYLGHQNGSKILFGIKYSPNALRTETLTTILKVQNLGVVKTRP